MGVWISMGISFASLVCGTQGDIVPSAQTVRRGQCRAGEALPL
jgi:hypothetical protein